MLPKAKTRTLFPALALLLLSVAPGCGEGEKELPPVQEKGAAATPAAGGPAGPQNAPPRTPVPKPSEK